MAEVAERTQQFDKAIKQAKKAKEALQAGKDALAAARTAKDKIKELMDSGGKEVLAMRKDALAQIGYQGNMKDRLEAKGGWEGS